MAQLPNWTGIVSAHLEEASESLMEAQAIAIRMANEDGVVTPSERAMLDSFRDAQQTMTDAETLVDEVEDEINAVTSTLRSGRRPRRYRCAPTDQTAA